MSPETNEQTPLSEIAFRMEETLKVPRKEWTVYDVPSLFIAIQLDESEDILPLLLKHLPLVEKEVKESEHLGVMAELDKPTIPEIITLQTRRALASDSAAHSSGNAPAFSSVDNDIG